MDLSEEKSNKFFDKVVKEGEELFKPGYTRFNIPFYFDEQKMKFVLDAIEFVANEGYKLMVEYQFNVEDASWTHHNPPSFGKEEKFGYNFESFVGSQTTCSNENTYLFDSSLILNETIKKYKSKKPNSFIHPVIENDKMRWFVLPHEIHKEILESSK